MVLLNMLEEKLEQNLKDILEIFKSEQQKFKEIIKCILLKLNEFTNKNVDINQISQKELFLLFVEYYKLKLHNDSKKLETENNSNVTYISVIAIAISMIITILASEKIVSFFNLDLQGVSFAFAEFLILVITIIVLLKLFDIAYVKNINKNSKKIIYNGIELSNYSFIKIIYEKFYLK